eukprot:GHVT01023670.1.p2 GENE.GHVT01023670.1~~GHVT01023670.1.p2  ORF type:complete len:194 (+),score=18.21 GHVT01023670.1:109-690(+)
MSFLQTAAMPRHLPYHVGICSALASHFRPATQGVTCCSSTLPRFFHTASNHLPVWLSCSSTAFFSSANLSRSPNVSANYVPLEPRPFLSLVSSSSKPSADLCRPLSPHGWLSPVPKWAIRGLATDRGSHPDFDPQPPAPPTPVSLQEAEEKIKKLLSSCRIVLFMKGSPESPMCGFSAKVSFSVLQQQPHRTR